MLSAFRHSRPFLLVVTAIVVGCFILTGCGSTNTQPSQAANNTVPSADKASNAAPSPETSDSPEAPAVRTVKDAYGDVQVPVKPERIVVLDIGALDNLLAMGVKPVGAPSILAAGDPYPAYITGTEGIANIGSVNEPNLEAIDALKPDVIIGNKDTHDQIHSTLAEIAPTVFVETLGVTWKENLLLHADTIGMAEKGQQLLDQYQTRIADLKTQLSAAPAAEISLIRPREDKVQIYLQETFAGGIMKEAGIKRPSQQMDEGFSKDVTNEQISSLDGDIILWFSRSDQDFNKMSASPLWATLKGVKEKRVHQVDWEYWMSGLGIQAVNKVVDDLFAYLVKA